MLSEKIKEFILEAIKNKATNLSDLASLLGSYTNLLLTEMQYDDYMKERA